MFSFVTICFRLFQHNGVTTGYTNHGRDLLANLRVLQTSSSPLLEDISSGRLPAHHIVNVPFTELAPVDLRKQRELDASELLKTTLVRQQSSETIVSPMAILDRKRDEAASKHLDAVIQNKPAPIQTSAASTIPSISTPSAGNVSPMLVHPHAESPRSFGQITSPRDGQSEADRIIERFNQAGSNLPPIPIRATSPVSSMATIFQPTPTQISLSSSESDYESEDENELYTAPNSHMSSKRSIKSPSEIVSIISPSPSASRTIVPSRVDSSSSLSPSAKLLKDSLKRKSSQSSANSTAPSSPSTPSSSSKRARLTGKSEVIDVRDRTPSPPPPTTSPLKKTRELKRSLSQPYHQDDPITLPERTDRTNISSFDGRLSFNVPRRGELPFSFYALPTTNLFASSGPMSASTVPRNKYDYDAWKHILPADLNQPQKMKATKLDTYIVYKSNQHSSAGSSASSQSASKLYPVTFTIESTDPLLAHLFADTTDFYEGHQLAIAVDYESSRIPANQQCSVWLIPPHSLHFITNNTARSILKWSATPRIDEWWGIVWMKSHVYQSMRQAVEDQRHRSENELDVPSDDEGANTLTLASSSARKSTIVDSASATPLTSVLELIQSSTETGGAADFLTRLLNKFTPTTATQSQPATLAQPSYASIAQNQSSSSAHPRPPAGSLPMPPMHQWGHTMPPSQ